MSDSTGQPAPVKLEAAVAHGAVALAAIVRGLRTVVEQSWAEALRAGASPEELGEIARMAHLFGGFPRALHGLASLAAALREAGHPTPAAAPESDRTAHAARGRALFESIYGSQAQTVLDRIDATSPGYASWILEHAYGRVLSRPGLTVRQRELLAVAALTALDCPDQLSSHARGALRNGATRAELRQVVEGLSEHVTSSQRAVAHARIQAMMDR